MPLNFKPPPASVLVTKFNGIGYQVDESMLREPSQRKVWLQRVGGLCFLLGAHHTVLYGSHMCLKPVLSVLSVLLSRGVPPMDARGQ